MKKCNWLLNPHCWHDIEGTMRKIQIYKEPPCVREPDSIFINDLKFIPVVKAVCLEECCKCKKKRKRHTLFDTDHGLSLPSEKDEPLDV